MKDRRGEKPKIAYEKKKKLPLHGYFVIRA
jgi:hypothetical protein